MGDLEKRVERYGKRAESELPRTERTSGTRWLGFSGAAAAAATLAPAAHAAVIYSGPRNIELQAVRNSYGSFGASTLIDLDGDAVADVWMNFSYSYDYATYARLNGQNGLGLMGTLEGYGGGGVPLYGVLPVGAGETIDSSRTFAAFFANNYYSDLLRFFVNEPSDPPSLVGFRMDGGEFGWLRVDVDPTYPHDVFRVIDWAYESTPGQSITTGVIPEPSSAALTGLGLLALGAAGVKRERARRAERDRA